MTYRDAALAAGAVEGGYRRMGQAPFPCGL